MVGFHPDQEVHLTGKEHAAAGAISGAFTRMCCQPLDVLKIRFQLQVEPIRHTQNSKYHGMMQALKTILRDEGWQALWKGHTPAQVLSILYGVAQFSSFELLTKSAWIYLPEEFTTKWRPLTHTVCGAFSGGIATIIIQPSDVIRTRFVAQGEPKVYKSVMDAVKCIVKEEGHRGLYKGLVPALSQIAPQMGLQFGFYSMFTGMWNQAFGILGVNPPGFAESVVCGSGSGLLAKVMVYPLDVVKKRLQIQGFEKARASFGTFRNYHGLVHCLLCVIREEGLSGLYKGLTPSLLKAATSAGFNFCVYDQVCIILMHLHR